jgi:hypothetical protein
MVGDTTFAIGAVAWVWFALQLMLTRGKRHPAPILDPNPVGA